MNKKPKRFSVVSLLTAASISLFQKGNPVFADNGNHGGGEGQNNITINPVSPPTAGSGGGGDETWKKRRDEGTGNGPGDQGGIPVGAGPQGNDKNAVPPGPPDLPLPPANNGNGNSGNGVNLGNSGNARGLR